MPRLILRIVLHALFGLLLGGAIVLGAAMLAVPIFNISQMEGGYAMGIVFFWMPLGAVIGALIAVARAVLRGRS